MSRDNPINVTQPFLPPLEEFIPYLQQIWDNKTLSNGGPFHHLLEEELCNYLGVNHISLFANGTVALLTALRALKITGEVITTPYSFVATSNALLWNSITPVFVDIDQGTLNLDPSKIEEAITPQTTAILPVHCYGVPCDVDAIQKVANIHKLKVIYDAAHAFGVKDNMGSLLNHGDLSVLSFHATKVFNTFEGGAVVCSDADLKKRIDELKNFGFSDEITLHAAGINGKMSEVNASFGLLQLKYVSNVINRRKEIDQRYRNGLETVKGIKCINNSLVETANYSYFPILVEPDYALSRDELYSQLKKLKINAKRYFYPLISNFSVYQRLSSANSGNLPTATVVASQIMCLPIYPDLTNRDVEKVIEAIRTVGFSDV